MHVIHATCSIHIPAMLPPAAAELEVPELVQTAAVLGLGLLYQGVCACVRVRVMDVVVLRAVLRVLEPT